VLDYGGTLERFAGDSIMVFFNDPVPIEQPALQAARMALAMQQAFPPIGETWRKRGFDLGLGCGIAQGYATLGLIGFEGRRDYAAIGNVTNLAARLCAEATGGQILVDRKVVASLDGAAETVELGTLTLKGLSHPVPAYAIAKLVAGDVT
jgi:adenylate cyclase